MSSRISTESWAGFIGGYFVAGSIFGIGFFLPSVVHPLSPVELQREELIHAGEGLLLAAASLFVGVRLLMVGQRYFAVATWYAAVCLLLTIFHEGPTLYHYASSNDYAISSAVLTFICQFTTLGLLLYVRSASRRRA